MRFAAAAVLLLFGCATAQATPLPVPFVVLDEPSFTAEFPGQGNAVVTNHTDSPAWVQVVWSVLQEDGTWWTYYVEAHTIEAGGSSTYRPDCVRAGLLEVYVVGHGLYRREWIDPPGYCY